MGRLEINCDLGEGEPLELTERIMKLIDAANISCGVHAGSQKVTKTCISMASALGISVGAHPGLPHSGGRGEARLSPSEFRELLCEQLGFFKQCCAEQGVVWNHVKLHGSLYHKVEVDCDLAQVYAEVLEDLAPKILVYSLANGALMDLDNFSRLSVRGELFADRTYQQDGSLTPRGEKGAVLSSEIDIVERLRRYLETGEMEATTGSMVALNADTVCVHSDTENALKIIKSIRDLLL